MEPVTSELPNVIQELRAALRSSRTTQDDDIPPETIAFLAVVPSLPAEVAPDGIPGAHGHLFGEHAIDLLDHLVDGNWVESATAALPWTGNLYRMSARQRRAAIRWLQKKEAGKSYGDEPAAAVLRLFDRARKNFEMPYPPAIERWCELVAPSPPDEALSSAFQRGSPSANAAPIAAPEVMADRLGRAMVHALSEARRLRLDTSSDATTLLDAAEPLAATYRGPVRVAYARAQRALELYQRRSSDFNALKDYLLRDELDSALKTLVSQEEFWALHYLGFAGSGKTMFLRHVDAKLSLDLNLSTARVDFDHLNPNYPLRLPGLLLLGFADELRMTAPEGAVDYFQKLQSAVTNIHRELEEAQQAGREIPLGFDAPGFSEALGWFVEGLKSIYATGRRPVLILDTCEELARITPDRGLPRTVGETFRILEETHRLFDGVRVVFSGRRALASAGPGWRIQGTEMPPRNYLMLCPIAGFPDAESRLFLNGYGKRSTPPRPVPIQYQEAILTLSVQTDGEELARIETVPVAGAVRIGLAGPERRHNPYDIALFAQWAASGDASFSPEKLSGKRHYYVRERIVARLREDLARWLPNLATLGRFDEELVAELTGAGEGFGALWAEIRRQEWIDVDRGTATVQDKVPLPFWNIDRLMRDRLEGYYSEEALDAWNEARQSVAGLLNGWTLERSWDLLSPSYFALTVRLLENDPMRAAEWWGKVEQRILDDDVWDWADKITSALLSPEAPKLGGEDGRHPLQASIYALRANVVMRQSAGDERLGGLWHVVGETLACYPTQEGRRLLMVRAAVGRIGQWRNRADLPSAEELNRIADDLRELRQTVPDLREVANDAMRAQLEYCGWATLENVAEILERLSGEQAIALTEGGNLLLTFSELNAEPYAVVCLQRIRRMLDPHCELNWEEWERQPTMLKAPSFDWVPPKDRYARQLLEWGRIFEVDRAQFSRQYQNVAVAYMGEEPHDADQDRLLSQALRLEGRGRRTVDELRHLIAPSIALGNAREECRAHRVIPPLCCTVIHLLACEGRVDAAVQDLHDARAMQPPAPLLRWLNGVSAYINGRFRLATPDTDVVAIADVPAEAGNKVFVFIDTVAAALERMQAGKLARSDAQSVRDAASGLALALGMEIPSNAAELAKVSPCWQPWFARYLLIVEESSGEAEQAAVRETLAALYPLGQRPADIAFPSQEKKSTEWMTLLLGFSILGAILELAVLGVGRVTYKLTGQELHWYQNILVLALLVWIGTGVPAMLRGYYRIVARFVRVRVKVRPSSASGHPWAVSFGVRVLTWIPSGRLHVSGEAQIEKDKSYAVASAPFGPGDKHSKILRSLMKWAFKQPLRLRTTIVLDDPGQAEVCWEALIGMGGIRTDSVKSPWLFRRTTPNSQGTASAFPGDMGVCVVSISGTIVFPSKAISGTASPLTAWPEYPEESIGVLILQAEVSVVNGGIRFSVGKQNYVTVNGVKRQFPELRLCILIDLERSELLARTPLDRISASRARLAAHELFTNGVAAVITIPYLPVRGEVMRQALALIAEAAKPVANAQDALQVAVQDVRELIFEECGLAPEDAAELAYDVCYYAADAIHLESGPGLSDFNSIRGSRLA